MHFRQNLRTWRWMSVYGKTGRNDVTDDRVDLLAAPSFKDSKAAAHVRKVI